MGGPLPDQQVRKIAHAERMLARAVRRQRQAARLVEKWKFRIAELERIGFQAAQARLWTDE